MVSGRGVEVFVSFAACIEEGNRKEGGGGK